MQDVHPVILSGGSGTRLWPASRKAFPKQFAPLLGAETLFQRSLRRVTGEGFAAPLVMTGEAFRFIAVEQAETLGLVDARVVVEPEARDTGPAILAAALMFEDTPNDLMLVTPSDHVISDDAAFRRAVQEGAVAAESGALVTFGVTPDRAETGYGYLKVSAEARGVGPVMKFTEKPDLETAEAMLATGEYLWNAGLFLGRVRDFLAAFEAHAPALMVPVRRAVSAASRDLGFTRLEAEAFGAAPAISLDYAVMEHVEGVMAVPLTCGWSDLGAWDALWAIADPDLEGNVRVGDVSVIDCADSYLRSEDPGVTLVGLGLRDVVAVAMRDAVLVADKSRAQEVKRVVETLRAADKPQADAYPRFYRPWGWYETLCIDSRFQVKRIMVTPGASLSLQSHRHRSEHWVVVAGTAEVTIGEDTSLITENQSVYVPLGAKHRLVNPGKVPVFLIEVQTGAYLGEDDVVRFEDVYNRI